MKGKKENNWSTQNWMEKQIIIVENNFVLVLTK